MEGQPHGEPFIEDGYWVVVADRQYRTAADMLRGEAGSAGIGKNLDPAAVEALGHEAVLEAVDPLLLTELLDPLFPWER